MRHSRSGPRRASPYTPFVRRFTDERARDLDDTIALHREVGRAFRASVWSGSSAIEITCGHILARARSRVRRRIASSAWQAVTATVIEVLDREDTIFDFPSRDLDVAVLSLKEQVDLCRFLRAKQHFLANDERLGERLIETLADLAAELVALFPEGPETEEETSARDVDDGSPTSILGAIRDFMIGMLGTAARAEEAVPAAQRGLVVPLQSLIDDVPAATCGRCSTAHRRAARS